MGLTTLSRQQDEIDLCERGAVLPQVGQPCPVVAPSWGGAVPVGTQSGRALLIRVVFRPCRRGDRFPCSSGDSLLHHYIKRLAGLPGETLGIDPPYLLVNEEKVTQPEIFNRIAKKEDGVSGFYPAKVPPSYPAPLASPSARITLGPDEYLVLGDNTLNSLDGRYFGPIKRRAIIGKAFYIYAPADRKRRLD
jgi:signal peptidase I